jgi:hypothetical protein
MRESVNVEFYQDIDLSAIDDLNLLTYWFNKLHAQGNENVSTFQAALWTRINELHPKFLLGFEDIK